jgi:hypothetical protein
MMSPAIAIGEGDPNINASDRQAPPSLLLMLLVYGIQSLAYLLVAAYAVLVPTSGEI